MKPARLPAWQWRCCSFGYEIFNFNLSLDEPLLGGAGQRGLASLFAAQGRWGMALQYAILPETVLPTVSTGLGVLLIGGSLWVISTRVFRLTPAVAGMVTTVAATLPTIGFAVSFATIALGIGLAFAASAVYGVCADSPTWQRLGLALGAGTLALGIYQGFAFVLLSISVTLVARHADWRVAARHVGLLGACVVANAVTGAAAKRVLGTVSNAYVSDLMDLSGLASDPLGRLVAAVERNADVLAPGASLYDNLQPWLALVLIATSFLAVRASLRAGSAVSRAFRLSAVLALLAIPVVAALLVRDLPIRSMVYLPVCLVGLVAIAAPADSEPLWVGTSTHRRIAGWLAMGLCVMAVIANAAAAAANQAYVASDAAFTRDRYLALRIDEELGGLFPRATEAPAVVVSTLSRLGVGTLGRSAEQFGLSLFSGESWRATSFLGSQGVQVSFPTAEQEELGLAAADDMPQYPEAGWAQDVDGVLVVNLGPDG